MIELPIQDPCEFCEGMAGRDETWAIIDECELTQTVINPSQYETGQCCVVTRRHANTLLDLTKEEGSAVIVAAKRVAIALVETYRPMGVLTFQNNGVYSGQEVPHYHFHVVPRYEREQRFEDMNIGDPGWPGVPDLSAGPTPDAAQIATLIAALKIAWPG